MNTAGKDDWIINHKENVEALLIKNDIASYFDFHCSLIEASTSFICTKGRSSQSAPIQEIKIDASRRFMSKTNAKGIIEFANDYFMKLSGYTETELMGQPYELVQHPDMPKVILDSISKKLKKGENFKAIVKHLSRDGDYFWCISQFSTNFDKYNRILAHYIHNTAVPKNIVIQIERIYKTLRSIEERKSTESANNYLLGLFEDQNSIYNPIILEILGLEKQVGESSLIEQKTNTKSNIRKRGVFSRLFR